MGFFTKANKRRTEYRKKYKEFIQNQELGNTNNNKNNKQNKAKTTENKQ